VIITPRFLSDLVLDRTEMRFSFYMPECSYSTSQFQDLEGGDHSVNFERFKRKYPIIFSADFLFS
jgi:hypothetical protein